MPHKTQRINPHFEATFNMLLKKTTVAANEGVASQRDMKAHDTRSDAISSEEADQSQSQDTNINAVQEAITRRQAQVSSTVCIRAISSSTRYSTSFCSSVHHFGMLHSHVLYPRLTAELGQSTSR